MTVNVFAPAKVNLTLHITGQRDDGYHFLDSLVAFSSIGDRLVLQNGNTLSLTVEGPESEGVPSDLNNLALKAAEIASQNSQASLTLEKYLPSASGIGGGSSDAAAAVRGILALEGRDTDPELLTDALLQLGADIPMCLTPSPCRVRGIGENIESVTLPGVAAILVNPRVPVHTADVFRALEHKNNAPMAESLPEFTSEGVLIEWLRQQRNDLEGPAISVAPVIADVLAALQASPGCRLARMSGSGATCFGLYESDEASNAACDVLREKYPEWWIMPDLIGDQYLQSLPDD